MPFCREIGESTHLDPVKLRLESLSQRATRLIVLANWLAIPLGVAVVILLFVVNVQDHSASSLEKNWFFILYTSVASACSLALLGGGIFFFTNIAKAFRCKWDRFRLLQVVTHGGMVLAMLFILAAVLASSAKPLEDRQCWWNETSTRYYFLLQMWRESALNLVFALLVVQAHSLCLVSDRTTRRCRVPSIGLPKRLPLPHRRDGDPPPAANTPPPYAGGGEPQPRSTNSNGHAAGGVAAARPMPPPRMASSQLPPPSVASSQLPPPSVASSQLPPPSVASSQLPPPSVASSQPPLMAFSNRSSNNDGASAAGLPTGSGTPTLHAVPVEPSVAGGVSRLLRKETAATCSSSSSSSSAPHVRLAAEASLWRLVPIALLFLAIEAIIIAEYFNLVSNQRRNVQEDDLFIRQIRTLDIKPISQALQNLLHYFQRRNSTLASTLLSTPSALLPSNTSIRTGLPGEEVPIHVWGVDPVDNRSGANSVGWTLGVKRPAVYYDMLLYRAFQNELFSDDQWAEAAAAFWYYSAAVMPLMYYCDAGLAGLVHVDDAVEAANHNIDQFLEALSLGSCSERNSELCYPGLCPADSKELLYNILYNVLLLLYAVMYGGLLLRASWLLRRHSYYKYRVQNVLVVLQMREGFFVFLFYLLSFTLLQYIGPEYCFSRLLTSMGVLPPIFVVFVCVFCRCWYFSPMPAAAHSATAFGLAPKFRWSESTTHPVQQQQQQQQQQGSDDKVVLAYPPEGEQRQQEQPQSPHRQQPHHHRRHLHRLLSHLSHSDRDGVSRPVFCMERALKCLFWSCTSYRDYGEGGDPVYSLAAAMSLDGHEAWHVVRHEESDTLLLAAWHAGHLTLAFRGSASLQNALTDANALPVPHRRIYRSQHSLRVPACVHKGFMWAWNAVREEVLDIVRQAPRDEGGRLRVTLCGHSLGGALATLAAYDTQQLLTKMYPGPPGVVHVSCITFGAPRTGNHSFARVYKAVVPDTWDVVNGRDMVPGSTKWVLRLYKRSGRCVIINRKGDLHVEPQWVELSVLQAGVDSVQDHYLTSYCRAFRAVLAAQADPRKAFEDGQQGVLALWRDERVRYVLLKSLYYATPLEVRQPEPPGHGQNGGQGPGGDNGDAGGDIDDDESDDNKTLAADLESGSGGVRGASVVRGNLVVHGDLVVRSDLAQSVQPPLRKEGGRIVGDASDKAADAALELSSAAQGLAGDADVAGQL